MPRITDGNKASANERRFTYYQKKKSMPATTSLLKVTESGAIMEDVSSFLTCSDLFLIPEIFPGRELEHALLNQTEQQLIFSL